MELEAIRKTVARSSLLLAWAPDWAIGLAALALAIGLALLVHYVAIRMGRRLIGVRRVFLGQLLSRTGGPTRLALVIFAVSLALQWAPFDPELTATIRHLLLIGFIVLVGWIAIIFIGVTADLYLGRFELGAESSLLAREHLTRVRILQRATDTLIIVVTAAATLMTFESFRQYGVSLFASAGVVGIVVGLAARPVLSNFIAGIQIAMTQPIRLEDAVTVENEFGWIEEIGAAYIVIRLWDNRRMIIPLSYFIEKPFKNWTRRPTDLIGAVILHVDYTAPVDRIRAKLNEIVAASALWDRKVVNLQVIDAKESTMQLQALVSAPTAGRLGDLQAEVREKLVAFLQQGHPDVLPKQRALVDLAPAVQPRLEEAGKPRASAA